MFISKKEQIKIAQDEYNEKEEWRKYIQDLKKTDNVSQRNINYLLQKLELEGDELSDEFKDLVLDVIETGKIPSKKIIPQKIPFKKETPKTKYMKMPKVEVPKIKSPGKPRLYKQDLSLPIFQNLLQMGYDFLIWHLNESEHTMIDICDELDGQEFNLDEFISGLQYSAPIFEKSHVGCNCWMEVRSRTNPDLAPVRVEAGDTWA